MLKESPILKTLNPTQREAVTADSKSLLVLAGAGSGKTRVLVHRIAWLLETNQASPFGILAVTFTNKAANEMRHRIEKLNSLSTQGMWIGTFHSLAHRLLRTHWQAAGLPETFQIIDSEDQYRLIRRIMRSMNIDEDQYSPKQIQWMINSNKEEGRRPEHLKNSYNPFEKTIQTIYAAYEATCQQNGLVDFAELLLRSHELWLKNPSILQHYQQRFQHILVDEFQDTNSIQYAWLHLLAQANNSITVVGDDDQSIYRWRGAKIENILHFQKQYSGTKVIKLEQNYRSTGNILNAANVLISNNADRLGKNLWTESGEGDPIRLYSAYNDRDEAQYIANSIIHHVHHGHAHQDCAILYRSNAQSRIIEDVLIQMNIPYRIYGGMRFFERAEIKDALAYLHLIANRKNDAAFERIINVPTRGIGNQTLTTVRQHARQFNLSMWEAACDLTKQSTLSDRAKNMLLNFINLIEQLTTNTILSLHEQTEAVITASGLIDYHRKEKGEKGRMRVENLEELLNATKQFETEVELDEHETPLSAFLSHAALEAGERQSDDSTSCVQLMTLHAAKGLEFPIVFLAGMEERLFPHQNSMDETGGLEEERRLCYVGMTRAMQRLHMTYADKRRMHGTETYQYPSRFIQEIPQEYFEKKRPQISVSRPQTFSSYQRTKQPFKTSVSESSNGFQLGQQVSHPSFGEGTILNFEGSGARARVQIKFEKHGVKWLVLELAKLEKR